ncbi:MULTISPECIES: hypothetical protein [unclassified Curtobacterium]|uniref:hypothetical protein n=1 Tax=unclassified Curtobacterium TaxID=257496 RepID=UPI0037F4667B
MTDTSTRPARPATTWDRHSPVRTGAELLLGLSFFVTVGFAGYGAATGHTSLVAQLGAIAFLTTLTCVLVAWFSGAGAPDEDAGSR